MNGSLPFNISKNDVINALKSFLKYLLGAALVYVGMQVQHFTFGEFTPIVMALAGFVVDLGHKYFTDTTLGGSV